MIPMAIQLHIRGNSTLFVARSIATYTFVRARKGYAMAATRRYCAPSSILPSLVVKIRMTILGFVRLGITKNKAPVIAKRIESPRTFLIFFTSPLPQNWAANIPPPLTIPKTSSENTKNTLFARPTAAMAVDPRPPIIRVSTIFTMVFNIPCSATGHAIISAFFKKRPS